MFTTGMNADGVCNVKGVNVRMDGTFTLNLAHDSEQNGLRSLRGGFQLAEWRRTR